jgi:hypothetical protein
MGDQIDQADEVSDISVEDAVDAMQADQEGLPDPNLGGGGSRMREFTTDDIDSRMLPKYAQYGYIGAIPSDKIKDIDPNKADTVSFVMNTDPSTKPGRHWVAVFINFINDRFGGPSVEYVDSFGEPPTKAVIQQIKQLVKKRRGLTAFLKFKVNQHEYQRENSITCGGHAMGFIASRYGRKSFKEATHFTSKEAAEKVAKKQMRSSPKTFGYI